MIPSESLILTLRSAPQIAACQFSAGISQKTKINYTYSKDSFKYSNGIATRNEPISSVEKILSGMTKKALPKGLQTFLDHLSGTAVRYASMCSGADTGKFALDHVLSCKSSSRTLDNIIDLMNPRSEEL